MACPLANQTGGRRRRSTKRVSRKGRKSTARKSRRVGRKVRKTRRRRRHRGGNGIDPSKVQEMMGALMNKK